jgi:hypothetical protein
VQPAVVLLNLAFAQTMRQGVIRDKENYATRLKLLEQQQKSTEQ